MAGTPFRPHDGPWRDSAVLAALAQLWEEAEQAGASLSQARLSRAAGVPRATLNDWAMGRALPRDPNQVDAVARVLAGHARKTAPALQVWEQLVTADTARRPVRSALGQPITGLDPFVLEVHRPVQPEDAPPGLPLLPPYMPREHDQVLGQVVRAAAGGRSQIAVLVGGSSTGKTRACWEALHLLRNQPEPWRLWHPIDPTRPDAALRELAGIGPRTVVWLNEAQFYLNPAEAELGEQVAAGLRELLWDPGRAPVLVLATVWPRFWDTLTARPADGDDLHAQARELLAGYDISVPPRSPRRR